MTKNFFDFFDFFDFVVDQFCGVKYRTKQGALRGQDLECFSPAEGAARNRVRA
jgi:hypothetical protein